MTQDRGGTTAMPPVGRWAMSTGKIFIMIFGAVFAMTAVGLLIGGVALAAVHTIQRDDDGFLTSPLYDMQTDRYALVSEGVDLASRPGDWWPSDPATVRFTVDPVGSKPIFIGIGRAAEVDAYLAGVGLDEVTQLGGRRSDVTYDSRSGGAPASLPGAQSFWVAASQGVGVQTLEWDLKKGEWKVVVMNADGSGVLRADVEAGVKIGFLLAFGIGLIVGGVVLGGMAAGMFVIGLSGNRKAAPSASTTARPGKPGAAASA